MSFGGFNPLFVLEAALVPVEDIPMIRKSKRLLEKPIVNYESKDLQNEVADISDCEDSEDEYKETEVDVQSDDSDLSVIGKVSKRNVKIRRNAVPLTDDETDDDEELRKDRKKNKAEIRNKIAEVRTGPRIVTRWIPDDIDNKLIQEHLIHPLQVNCKKMTHLRTRIPEDVVTKVFGQKELTSEDKQFVSKTPDTLKYALVKLMGLLQKQLSKEDPELLDENGHLHLNQLFSFLDPKFVRPRDIRSLLEECPYPSVRLKMKEAYDHLMDQLFQLVSESTGKFCEIRNERDKEMETAERRERGLQKQALLLSQITNIKALNAKNRPYAKWGGQREDLKKKRDIGLKVFQGSGGVPDPSIIVRKWLGHPSTTELDKKILEAASKKEIVSHRLFNRITNQLMIRFSCAGGLRKEALHLLKWGHVVEAFKKGYACYPNNKLHLNPACNMSEVNKHVVTMEDGEKVYIRQDPWSEDNLDPEDPMKNADRFNALKGLCCTLHVHKTGDKYPCYIFFNLIDVKYLLAYEEISKNYMEHLGIKMSIKSSVFVNGSGGPFINLDLTGFCEVVGLPRCTYFIFRDMYVDKVYSSQIGKYQVFVIYL